MTAQAENIWRHWRIFYTIRYYVGTRFLFPDTLLHFILLYFFLITSATDISDLYVGNKITLPTRHSVVDCIQRAMDKVKGQAQMNKLTNDQSSLNGRECVH